MSTERKYLIWSEEHGGWWRPAFEGTTWGYTHSIVHAGRYSEPEALRICTKANAYVHPGEGFNPDRTFNEMMVPDPMV